MKRLFLPILGYLLVVMAVFGPTLLLPSTQLIFGDDIHRAYYFYREFFNYFVKLGIFPWWNPYLFAGSPFIANPVVNIWYPATWLFIILPLNLAYSLHLVFHITFAMVGMYWLLKRAIGEMGEVEAWVGGLVFGLSGFFMARVWAGHIDLIAAAAWMPWVFGAFWRLIWGAEVAHKDFAPASEVAPHRQSEAGQDFVGSPRPILFAAGLLALQLYAGYQTMAFFTIEAVGIATLLNCVIVKSLKTLGRVLLAGILGLGLAGLQLIPEQEFFRSSIRTYVLPYSWNSYGAITFESLKQLANPFFFGNQLTYHGPAPNFSEHAMFVGLAALVLAGLAIVSLLVKTRKAPVIVFATVAFFGVWMSLAENAPFDLQKLLWQILPMYHYLRIPARHLVLFVFGMSALSGFGLEMFKLPKPLKLAVVGLILVELVPLARQFIVVKEIPEMRHDQKLVSLFKQDQEPYRVLPNFGVWVPPRDSFDFDSAASYRIYSASGYDPSIMRSYYEFFDAVNGSSGPSIQKHDVQVPYLNVFSPYTDFLNIKYLLLPREYDPLYGSQSDRFNLVKEDQDRDYRLYENKNVLSRFYFVNQAEFLAADKIKDRLRVGDVDLKSTVLVDQTTSGGLKPYGNCTKSDQQIARLTSFSPNSLSLRVSTACDSYLVSSEIWYPGWLANIDGKKADIMRSNLSFRTIFIPKGSHTVVMAYSPKIFLLGGALSLVTLVFAFLLLKKRRLTSIF